MTGPWHDVMLLNVSICGNIILSTVVCGTCFAEPDTILVFKIFYGVFGGRTRLAMLKTNLHAGLIVIEAWFRGYSGSPGLCGIRTAGLYTSSGLLKREDTRLKTLSRVRMELSFAWKASLAIRILCFLPCNRLHVNPSPLRCLYKPERMVLRRPITITKLPS